MKNLMVIVSIVAFILFIPLGLVRNEFPVYRVVLDPGHGGVSGYPLSIKGDRYDPLSGRFLDLYKDGASWRDLEEHAIVYSIAEKVNAILFDCTADGDYSRFKAILKSYAIEEPPRIQLETALSREPALTGEQLRRSSDPNEGYRLFDAFQHFGFLKKGRLSNINSLKPQLVVSLHLALSAPRDYEGMNPVIVPPYPLLEKGLRYLQGKTRDRDILSGTRYADWFIEEDNRSAFHWFLNDSSLYFTGYPIDDRRAIQLDKFKGYRYNMITWKYRDSSGWEHIAKKHPSYTRFATSYETFVPEGKFWERERSEYEQYRRDGGPEKFGGDNSYASYELIRYMLYSLYRKGDDHPTQKPGKPYNSVWIVPLHVNAVNAFIELGYLSRRRDRYILTEKQNELAEGIAVGIYSLFAGIRQRESGYRYLPRGARIDWEKYRLPDGRYYFDAVAR